MVPEPTEGQEIKINRLLWESACPDPDEYIGKIGIVIGPTTVNRFLKGLFESELAFTAVVPQCPIRRT